MKERLPRAVQAVGITLAASFCGAILYYAWIEGLWGLGVGGLLCIVWSCAVAGHKAIGRSKLSHREEADREIDASGDRTIVERLLLDAVPVPLVAIHGGAPRAINRASRSLFETDDRILPFPPALLDPQTTQLTFANRAWRIDRVSAGSGGSDLGLAVLIDVEKDRLAAEDAASAELIEILGHELMNGLSPIVSLAETARSAAEQQQSDNTLLLEILGPLSRRAEALHRFAASYHALAKLPDPDLREVPIDSLADDLRTAFEHTWPSVALEITSDDDIVFPIDPDQLYQAIWAILQNAAEAVASQTEARIEMRFDLGDESLAIVISDSGNGISAEAAPHIFRPFFTTKRTGSGIGLALARQIARSHGGTLALAGYSPAEFLLTVPRRLSTPAFPSN
ncbi:MAG: HAMP domain-containing sensor histidine kinase [Erythrobacter sp.]|nr:HAMP domain-containing sensor histidine kinase [Erythrobacter sp.]